MGFEWARPTSFAEPMFTVGGVQILSSSAKAGTASVSATLVVSPAASASAW